MKKLKWFKPHYLKNGQVIVPLRYSPNVTAKGNVEIILHLNKKDSKFVCSSVWSSEILTKKEYLKEELKRKLLEL